MTAVLLTAALILSAELGTAAAAALPGGDAVRVAAEAVRVARAEEVPASEMAGMLREIRPAADILHELAGDAADILSNRLPSSVRASVA